MSVRWDAVVNCSAVGIGKGPSPSPLSTRDCRASVQVHVQLFGALAAVSPERLIQLELPTAATIADVLAILGKRLGGPFSARVLDRAGAKYRHCRLFVDGYPIEHLRTPLDARSGLTQIEIILLIAPLSPRETRVVALGIPYPGPRPHVDENIESAIALGHRSR